MKNSKKSVYIGIIVLLVVTLLLLGLTYAYYKTRIIGNENPTTISAKVKKLMIEYKDGTAYFVPASGEGTTEINGTVGNVEPGDVFIKEFNVENSGDETISYGVLLDNLTNTFTRTSDWIYTLYEDGVSVSSGEVPAKDEYIYDSISIDAGDTNIYKLEVTYKNLKDEDQSVDMGKSLSFRVNIYDAKPALFVNANEGTLLQAIGKNNIVSEPETTPGKEVARIEKGYKLRLFDGDFQNAPGYNVYLSSEGPFECYESYQINSNGNIILEDKVILTFEEAYNKFKNGEKCYHFDTSGITNGKLVSNYNVMYEYFEDVNNFGYIYFRTYTEILVPENAVASTSESAFAKTEDDYGESYYYRGYVDNNYVRLGSLCFRIVRVQGDGSIRMILSSASNSSSCASVEEQDVAEYYIYGGTLNLSAFIGTGTLGYDNYDSSKYPKYLNYDTTDATAMKNVAETWYFNNLSKYDSVIKYSEQCIGNMSDLYNDSTKLSEDEKQTYLSSLKGAKYYSSVRLKGLGQEITPSLKCEEGAIKTSAVKIFPMSVDEFIFAGGKADASNFNYLMEDAYNQTWWTLTPATFGSSTGMFQIGKNNGWVGVNTVTATTNAFRPMIALKADTLLNSGDGTIENPYTVKVS